MAENKLELDKAKRKALDEADLSNVFQAKTAFEMGFDAGYEVGRDYNGFAEYRGGEKISDDTRTGDRQQPPEFWFAYGQTKHELEKDHAAKARAWELEHKTMKAPEL